MSQVRVLYRPFLTSRVACFSAFLDAFGSRVSVTEAVSVIGDIQLDQIGCDSRRADDGINAVGVGDWDPKRSCADL